MDLAVEAHLFAQGLPRAEQFALAKQIRDAAASVPGNIAEGCGRGTTRELLRFLDISRGSLQELDSHFELAFRLGYSNSIEELQGRMNQVSRMISGLKAALRKKLESEGE